MSSSKQRQRFAHLHPKSQTLGSQCRRKKSSDWHMACLAIPVVLRALISVVFLSALLKVQAQRSLTGEFEFEQRGGLLWVKVSVPQSAEPLNFLVDSGAGVSVVNLRTAKRLGMELGQLVDV